MHFEGLQSVFRQNGCRISFLALVKDLSFSNQGEGDMGKLYQIATGPYTAVFGYVWSNPPVDKLGNEQCQFFMYAGFSLQKSIETRYHGSFDIEFRKGLPCSGSMAADDIIL